MCKNGVGELLLCSIIVPMLPIPRWISKVEHVWDKKWLGYCLIATSFVVFAWFNWRLPPSGYGVVAMAVVAGVMAIRPKVGGWERSLWFVVLVSFAIIEIKAINHDRDQASKEFGGIASGLETTIDQGKQSIAGLKTTVDQGKASIAGLQTTIQEGREHFDMSMRRSDRILGGVSDSIKAQTGGDSFAFISFTAQQAHSFETRWNNFIAPSPHYS